MHPTSLFNLILSGKIMKISIALFLCFLMSTVHAEKHEHGYVNKVTQEKLQVWDASNNEWLSAEKFWQNFASSNKAKYWGETKTYPKYGDVSEFDTVLIQLHEGSCLMQFFHGRWRRANDVQRWDDSFNDYSGCPFVFD